MLVITSVIVVRLQPGTAVQTAAAAANAGGSADLSRDPWFRLQLLHTSVALIADPANPAGAPPIHAAAGILIDADTGRILWSLNPHARLAPASTIKLLTALVVLENFNEDRRVTATAGALTQQWDESKMGLKPGNTLTVRELVTAMLVVSANDAADVLAVDTVGLERFVGAMNAQAQALGLRDTHAASPVGLDDPQTYSSAYDLAELASLDTERFPLFDDVVKQQYVQLPSSALHPEFDLYNLNLLLPMYSPAIGIKTGYTGNAGGCLVGEAIRGGHRLISVVLNADYVYSQSRTLLDWGFTRYGLPTQLPTPTPSPSPSPAPHH
jgi:D-alanyl-D-alanine carboxypeptidase (penicillin-binding protein 5/6)